VDARTVAVLSLHTRRVMKTFTLIAALLFAPAAYAQSKTTDATNTTKTTDTAKPAKLTASELQVLAHFHAVNLMEIDLGKAAQRLAKTDGVKQYGKMLVTDHTDADKKLVALAKKRGQMIPAEKPTTDTEKQDQKDAKAGAMKLKKLKGAEFDTAFLTAMVDGHEKELAKCDAKASEVQDTELGDMLRAMKPTLQMHADHARELQQAGSGVSTTTPPSTTSTPTTAKR
jgi:putative membrane protein